FFSVYDWFFIILFIILRSTSKRTSYNNFVVILKNRHLMTPLNRN
ncbi:hypothetical protein M153_90420001010, partial [Pseudoloma neurophilia]